MHAMILDKLGFCFIKMMGKCSKNNKLSLNVNGISPSDQGLTTNINSFFTSIATELVRNVSVRYLFQGLLLRQATTN